MKVIKIKKLIQKIITTNESIIIASLIFLFLFRLIFAKYIAPFAGKTYEIVFTLHEKPVLYTQSIYIFAFILLNIIILLESFSVKIKRYYLREKLGNPEDRPFNIWVTHNVFILTRGVFGFVMVYFSAVSMINWAQVLKYTVKTNWTNGTLVFNSEKIVVLVGSLAFIIVMFVILMYILAFSYPRFGVKDLILSIEERFKTKRAKEKAKFYMLLFSEFFATIFTFIVFTFFWETKFLVRSLISAIFKIVPYFPLNVYDIPNNFLQLLFIIGIVFLFVIFARNISLMSDVYRLKGRNSKIRFALYFIILLIFVLVPFYKFYNSNDYYKRGIFYCNNKEFKRAIDDFDLVLKKPTNNTKSSLSKIYYYRGIAYKEIGDKEKAHNDFEKAKEILKN